MLTDSPPRKRNLAGFQESDRRKTLDLPEDDHLLVAAKSIEVAMNEETIPSVRRACAEFLAIASEFYEVPICSIRVLAARPLRVRENWTSKFFGDYDPSTKLIRVWMRTAIAKTSPRSERS